MPKYPDDWKQISLAVRTAANWQCQHCERQCRKPREPILDFIARTGYEKAEVEAHPRRWSLQTAHVNHDPENKAAELIALCVTCHRQYDNRQMARIKALERERNGQLSVHSQPPKPLEGFAATSRQSSRTVRCPQQPPFQPSHARYASRLARRAPAPAADAERAQRVHAPV